jgi:hypothetical protein
MDVTIFLAVGLTMNIGIIIALRLEQFVPASTFTRRIYAN